MKRLFLICLSFLLLIGIFHKTFPASAYYTKEYGVVSMNNLETILLSADSIELRHNGKSYQIDTNSITTILQEMLKNSHEMPALGVALDNETKTAMQTGYWLEFNYKDTHTYNDMYFDKLLIEVNPEFGGFNIIRHHDNEYSGRCYYIQLSNTMQTLYNYLNNI